MEAVKACRRIEGWLSNEGIAELFALARDGNANAMQVGSWKGRSAAALCYGMVERSKPHLVFTIDHFLGSGESEHPNVDKVERIREFHANLTARGLLERHVTIVADSQDAWRWLDPPIDLLFIDGGHDEDAVQADVRGYTPRLDIGGHLVLHDVGSVSSWPGPAAVAEQLRGHPDFSGVRHGPDYTVFRREQ